MESSTKPRLIEQARTVIEAIDHMAKLSKTQVGWS